MQQTFVLSQKGEALRRDIVTLLETFGAPFNFASCLEMVTALTGDACSDGERFVLAVSHAMALGHEARHGSRVAFTADEILAGCNLAADALNAAGNGTLHKGGTA